MSKGGVINSVAARVCILERERGAARCEEWAAKPLTTSVIVDAARGCHDTLDRAAGTCAHSLAAALRRDAAAGSLGGRMAYRIARLSRAADAVRHITPYALEVLSAELQLALTDEGDGEVGHVADTNGDVRVNREEFSKYTAWADAGMGSCGVEAPTEEDLGGPSQGRGPRRQRLQYGC